MRDSFLRKRSIKMEKFNPNVIFVGLGQFHQFHPFRAVILDKAILSLSFFLAWLKYGIWEA